MTFVFTRGNPDNLVGGGPAAMGDVQGPFYDIRDYLNGTVLGKPPTVTSLPSSPADGDEVYYIADATNGIVWHLRYRAASASPYKWEFIGGSPLTQRIDADESYAQGGSYVDPGSPGPRIAVPLAGDYGYNFTANEYILGQTTNGSPQLGLSVNAAVPAIPHIATVMLLGSLAATVTKTGVLLALATAADVKLVYQASGVGGAARVRYRELQMTPRRVG